MQPIYDEDEAKNIAELVMEHATGLPLIERVIKKNEHLSVKERERINQSIERLLRHEPVQYIISECWFAGMRFYVDRNVLIPRPETEELVEWVVKDFTGQDAKLKVLDVGAGSGCIAIALKTKLPRAEVWACDISDEALIVARMNADALHAAVDFLQLDFLDPGQRKQLPRVDVIVSNPPYIPQKDEVEMKKNVVMYEPPTALFVPDNERFVFYKAIGDFGKEKLSPGGSIYLEIHESFGEEVKNLFLMRGYRLAEIKKDLQGKNRMIKVKF